MAQRLIDIILLKATDLRLLSRLEESHLRDDLSAFSRLATADYSPMKMLAYRLEYDEVC